MVPPRGGVTDSPRAPCPVLVAVHLGSGDVYNSVEFGVRLGRFGWGSVMFFFVWELYGGEGRVVSEGLVCAVCYMVSGR